jgi:NADPH2:quinone reductase
VVAVGDGVTGFAPGDRVGHCGGTRGDYATARLVPARELFDLPPISIS